MSMSLLTIGGDDGARENLSDIADASPEMLGEIVGIPKEIILISLVAQEQALYNPKHEHYRNTQHKDSKWLQIADSVGWTETQCKSKWKAMRDQYCRELKRFKSNAKANVKWKYFKELAFLRPYALSRNYRPRHVVNNNNNNNNNSFNNSSSNNSLNNSTSTSNENKFTNIKIEAVRFGDCDFATAAAAATAATNNTTQNKNESARLLTPLTDEQLSSVMQQQQTDGNWNYLTATTATPTLTTNATQQQTTTNEELYCAFVNCVAAVAASGGDMQQSTQLQQQQQPTAATEEEDDDPIHTFLNIESYFEKELIAMVHQEDILYNSFHPNYRNTKLKYEVWDEISRKLKKTMRHCRLKWKALRDQYIREHKRLKNRENVESLPRWKHYDALNFLQKFIKHKTDDFESKHMLQVTKIELDADIDPLHVTPLQSPTLSETVATHELQQQQAQLQLQTLPSLTGPHEQHEQQQFQVQQQQLHPQSTHDDVICVVNVSGNTDTSSAEAGAGADSGSVSCYDEMDIDTYIIGEGSDEPHGDVDDDNAEEEHEDHKSQQQFPHYNHNSNSDNQRTIKHDHDVDFKDIKSITQDSAHTQLAAATQQQHVLAVNGEVSPDESLQQQQEQEFLMVTSAESNTATTTSLVRNSPLNGLNGPSCSTSSTASASTTAIVAVPASDADDEVGAFFAAVAMKIRNAKMSPVAFTDLQIEILRVINGSLRHQ